jgi:hypothetical protein
MRKNSTDFSAKQSQITKQKDSRQSAESPLFKPKIKSHKNKKPTDDPSLGDLETTALPTELYP